jgi:stage II sporulation protein P
MYHTHGTESYLHSKAENYRTSDNNSNIVAIGNVISTVLEANGHTADHVETHHDLPSYNKSYSRSLNTVNTKKGESENLQILLDVHRNAVLENAKNIDKLIAKSKVEIDGKTVATFSLVIGPDSPNKDKVLNFAKYIKAVSDALYPNLCEGIIIKPTGKYNQHLSDYSALIEIGYNFHTFEEANNTAKLVGEILSLAINSIIEE